MKLKEEVLSSSSIAQVALSSSVAVLMSLMWTLRQSKMCRPQLTERRRRLRGRESARRVSARRLSARRVSARRLSRAKNIGKNVLVNVSSAIKGATRFSCVTIKVATIFVPFVSEKQKFQNICGLTPRTIAVDARMQLQRRLPHHRALRPLDPQLQPLRQLLDEQLRTGNMYIHSILIRISPLE